MAEGDPGGLRVADRGRGAGLRGGHHEVSVHRVLLREPAPHLHAGLVHRAAVDGGVRAREVHVLEDAPGGRGLRETARAQPVLVDRDELAGLDLAHQGGAHDVQRGGLGGHHPAAFETAQHERAHTQRITGGVEGGLVHEREAERPHELGEQLHGCFLERVEGVLGQQCRDQGGVRGVAARHLAPGREPGLVQQQVVELRGVRQVAVVRERQGAVRRGPQGGLRIGPVGGARGGVPGVAHGQVPLEGVEGGLVEDLGHEPHVLVDRDPLAVRGGDARGLLPAVLQRVETVVGQLGDVLAGSPHAEHAARVLGAFLTGKKVMGEFSVSSNHERQCLTSACGARLRERPRPRRTRSVSASTRPGPAAGPPRHPGWRPGSGTS